MGQPLFQLLWKRRQKNGDSCQGHRIGRQSQAVPDMGDHPKGKRRAEWENRTQQPLSCGAVVGRQNRGILGNPACLGLGRMPADMYPKPSRGAFASDLLASPPPLLPCHTLPSLFPVWCTVERFLQASVSTLHPKTQGRHAGKCRSVGSSLLGVNDSLSPAVLPLVLLLFPPPVTAGRARAREPGCCAVARGAESQIQAMQGKGPACQRV